MTRVLVLRPQPGADATVEKARALGLDPIPVPLFSIEPVDWQVPDAAGFDRLLLTSANALRHGGEQLQQLRGLKVFAVGEATAEAARNVGLDIAATGEAGVDRLLASIEPDLKLLHLCGADRRELEESRQQVTSVIVYRSAELERPDLACAPGSLTLIHSPRAGRRFAELVGDRASITIAAISRAAADAVGRGWKQVEAADQPSDEALLALAARLCNNSPPQ